MQANAEICMETMPFVQMCGNPRVLSATDRDSPTAGPFSQSDQRPVGSGQQEDETGKLRQRSCLSLRGPDLPITVERRAADRAAVQFGQNEGLHEDRRRYD